MTEISTQFVISHEFTRLNETKKNVHYYGKKVVQLGVDWAIKIFRVRNLCYIGLECLKYWEHRDFCIEAIVQLTISRRETKLGKFNHRFETGAFLTELKWKTIKRCLDDQKLTISFDVTIVRVHGLGKSERDEDEPEVVKEVTLVIGDDRITVLKETLLTSKLFEFQLSRIQNKFKPIQILLKEDINQLKNLIKCLQRDMEMDDEVVDGILRLAVKYHFSGVVAKCEEFLIIKSVKPFRAKIEIMEKYELQDLKIHLNYGSRQDLHPVSHHFLTCKICFGILKGMPVRLECLHTFCEDCVENLPKTTEENVIKVHCPTCEHSGELANATPNHGVVSILESL